MTIYPHVFRKRLTTFSYIHLAEARLLTVVPMVVEARARLSNHLVHVEEALGDGAVDPLVLNTGHVELAELGKDRTEVAVAP